MRQVTRRPVCLIPYSDNAVSGREGSAVSSHQERSLAHTSTYIDLVPFCWDSKEKLQ